MKRVLLLILLGIFIGQIGFCEEKVQEISQETLSETQTPVQDNPQSDLPIEEIPQLREEAPTTEEEIPAQELLQDEIPKNNESQEFDLNNKETQEFDLNNKDNIPEIYRSLEVPTHKYVHDLDPEEFVDTQNAAWSPYSLFRLTAPLYFKTIAIKPGYYLLTPREHAGNWYMLFKENGKIKHIIPIYNKEIVPLDFYKDNLPEEKTTWSQRQHLKLLKFVGKFKSSQRPEMPKTYLEAEDLDDNFIVIKLYWGDYIYHMVLRSIPM